MPTDLEARAPKYQRVADQLRQEIRSGRWAPRDRLPAETALVERFRVSLPTVRQAIGVLRAEGLVESRHGIGTFVKDGRRYAHARDQWVARMLTVDEAAALELATGAAVMHVVHIARDQDGAVLEVSESVRPADRILLVDDYPVEQEAEPPPAPSDI